MAADSRIAERNTPRELDSGAPQSRWPLERVLFALAGTMTLVSALLAAVVSPWFLVLTLLVGINQWLYVSARACPASFILERFGVAPRCRW